MSKSLSKSRFVEMFGNIKETIPLENCCSLISDFVASGSFASLRDNVKYYDKENYAVLVRTIDFANNFSKDLVYTDKHGYDFLSKTNLYGGEILLSNIGASIGKVFRVPYLNKPMTLAPNSIVIKPNDNYTNEFLEYFFSIGRGQDELHVMTTATATPKFNKTQLRQVPVPKVSKEIQNDFSCFVKQLDKSKFILQKMIEKLELLKKSRFIEMFGDPNSNAKGYDKKPLRDLFALQMGKTPPRKEMKYWTDATNKWISISDMSTYDKYTTDTKEKIADCAISDTGIKVVPKNTVIMSFKLSIGKTAITSEDIYTNEAIMAFVKKNEKINNSFLSYALKMVDWTSTSSNAVKGVTLNKEIIGNKDFFIPPIELQNEFEKFSNQVDKSKLILQKQLEDLVGETK